MAKKTKKPKLSAVEKMLATKRKLVDRLRRDITIERQACAENVKQIESRIRIAQSLIGALEKGSLKL